MQQDRPRAQARARGRVWTARTVHHWIPVLGFEVRIVRQFEPLHPPWLEIARPPDSSHGVLADTVALTHRPCRPRRRTIVGNRVQRVGHDRLHRLGRDLRLAAPTRRDHSHRRDPVRQVAVPPARDRIRIRPQPRRGRTHRGTISQRQQRRGRQNLAMRRDRRTRQPLQLHTIARGHVGDHSHATPYATLLFQRRTTR
jgi:hypothetical protein